MNDALLSEVERQKKYLAELPPNYTFPLFNARQAVESQRRSGYKDTAAAGREIVDNAIEAGATQIDVIFDVAKGGNGKRLIRAVAFVDNGSGMLPEMARYALSWGGGTHFNDPSFIGKFGFGLPNASINQTRRVEVYTRTGRELPFSQVYLDINDLEPFGPQLIQAAEPAELPSFVQQYLNKSQRELAHGTVVVWITPDRLAYRTPANLREHLLDDFGVTYRYLLRRNGTPAAGQWVDVLVDGSVVEATDPLFLLPGGRLYLHPEEGGAHLSEDLTIAVKYSSYGPERENQLARIADSSELESLQPGEIVSTIRVRIARFPIGFADGARSKGQSITDAHRRFEIRKSRRGMSFVRGERELQTIDVFPRTPTDIANGLGEWPLLQGYAYHWGIETTFGPELDDAFGITNDKQGVRPIEDFWRILAQEGIDGALQREQQHQTRTRKRKTANDATPPTENGPTVAEEAAQAASAALGKPPRVPERHLASARDRVEREAGKKAEAEGTTVDAAREALQSEAKRRRYRITYFDAAHGPLYEPKWNGQQIEVKVNRQHPFYEYFYADLLQLPGGLRAHAGLDILLIALAQSELTTDESTFGDWVETQRRFVWSPFLDTTLRSVVRRLDAGEPDDEALG